MSLPYFVAFDLETGGTDEKKNAILTGYFAILDKDLNLIQDLELYFKPPEHAVVEAGALEANGINMAQHLARSDLVSYEEGAVKIVDLIKKNKPKRTKLRIFGYNVLFDIKFITKSLIDASDWEAITHHVTIDPFNIINFLKDIDFVPQDLGNLSSVVKYFGINEGLFHTARDDVHMTVEVYRKIRSAVSSSKASGNSQEMDLLEIIE
jgi:DNA polymerase III epsilon subunit-like protein